VDVFGETLEAAGDGGVVDIVAHADTDAGDQGSVVLGDR
jgi:hypothetical protein